MSVGTWLYVCAAARCDTPLSAWMPTATAGKSARNCGDRARMRLMVFSDFFAAAMDAPMMTTNRLWP